MSTNPSNQPSCPCIIEEELLWLSFTWSIITILHYINKIWYFRVIPITNFDCICMFLSFCIVSSNEVMLFKSSLSVNMLHFFAGKAFYKFFDENNKTMFCCKTCHKRYKHQSSCYNHWKFECNRAPQFQCELCQKRFKFKGNMKLHMANVHNKFKHNS